MAYGTRYKLDYDHNEYGKALQVLIQEEDYTGSITSINGGYVPILKGYQNSGTDQFKTINPCFLDLQLLESSTLYDVFSGADIKKYKIRYYEDSVLNFEGYLDTSKLSHPFKTPPYIFKIRAIDGLTLLKNEKYKNGNNLYTGKVRIFTIIYRCLEKLGYSLPIWTAVNLYSSYSVDDGLNGNDNDPLYLHYVDQELFLDEDNDAWNCYDVLQACVSVFGCELYQEAGNWNIIRVSEKDEPYYRRRYAGGLFDQSELFNPQVTLTDNNQTRLNRLGFIKNNTVIEFLQGYKTITINIDRTLKPSLFEVYQFEGEDADGTEHDWYDSNTKIKDWTVTNRATAFGISQDTEGSYNIGSRFFYPAIIEGTISGSSNNTPLNASSLKSPAFRILSDSNTKVKIDFEYRIRYDYYNENLTGILYYFIVFTDNFGDIYYYKNKNLGWIQDNLAPTFLLDRAWKTQETNVSLEFTKISHEIDLPQSDGTLHVEFFQMAKASYNIETVIKSCTFQYLYNDILLKESEKVQYISNKNVKEIEYKCSLFDAPSTSDSVNVQYIKGNSFFGTLYYLDSVVGYRITNKWKENPETGYTTIQQRLLTDLSRQLIQTIKIINGTIKGSGINRNNTIIIPDDDNTHYVINRLITDKLREEMEIELIEIKRYTAETLADELNLNILDENGDPINVFFSE